jgi:hypothetical protein
MFGHRILKWKVQDVDAITGAKTEKEVSTTADEVVSVLQKEIRRGSRDALIWGTVLHENGYANAAFNRLRVIAMEDAAVKIRLPVVVDALYDEFKSAMKKNGIKKLTETKSCEECKTALLKAIQLLVSSPKTRCLNHALALARKTLIDEVTVLDAKGALNEFNAKIALGDFESTLVAALRVMIWDNKECTFGMWKTMKEMINFDPLLYTLQKWKNVNESLSIAQALVLVLRSKVQIDGNDANPHFLSGFDVQKMDASPLVVGQIPPFLAQVPDYAIDKHTSCGKKMGRGVAHFYTVGALVNNEPFADPWVDRARAWYEEIEKGSLGAKVKAKSKSIIKELLRRWKLVLGVVDPPKSVSQSNPSKRKKDSKKEDEEDEEDSDATESDDEEEDTEKHMQKHTQKSKTTTTKQTKKFAVPVSLRKEGFPGQSIEEFKNSPFDNLKDGVLTQIPCAAKPPAMVGVWTLPEDAWSGRRVFLKGPESRERALTQQWFNCIKAKLDGIRPIETRVLCFNDKYYILMEDLSHGWTTQSAMKKETPITIIKSGTAHDDSRIMQEFLRTVHWSDIPESMVKDYLAILMMRQLLGSSDTCNRNILQRGDQLWSVDECVSGKPLTVLIAHITKSLKDQLSQWFVKHRQWCLDLLQTWKNVQLTPYLHRDIADRFAHVEQKVNEF